MKTGKVVAVAVLLLLGLLLPCSSKAQVYVTTKPTFCSAASSYPIHDQTQFFCHYLVEEEGSPSNTGTLFQRNDNIVEFWGYADGVYFQPYPGEYFQNFITPISFSLPSCMSPTYPWYNKPGCNAATQTPGTISFAWQQFDYPSGTWSHGIASGTWLSVRGGCFRQCWQLPEVLTFTTTREPGQTPAPVASLYKCGSDRHPCLKG